MKYTEVKTNLSVVQRSFLKWVVFLMVTMPFGGTLLNAQVLVQTANSSVERKTVVGPTGSTEVFVVKNGAEVVEVSLIPKAKFKGISASMIGGKDGGGGDPSEMVRSFLIENRRVFSDETMSLALLTYFGDDTNYFRIRMISVLSKMKNELFKIKDEKIRQIFAKLIKKGLLQDIAQSPLIFKNECHILRGQHKIPRAATALMNKPGTPVCVDPIALAAAMKGNADSVLLFGFIIHEYSHHFGYEDANYAIANHIALTLRDIILAERSARGYAHEDVLYTIASQAEGDIQKPENSDLKRCIQEKNCFED